MFYDQPLQIVYLLLLLLLVSVGVWSRRPSAGEVVRHGGLWLLIIAGLALFYEVMRRFSA